MSLAGCSMRVGAEDDTSHNPGCYTILYIPQPLLVLRLSRGTLSRSRADGRKGGRQYCTSSSFAFWPPARPTSYVLLVYSQEAERLARPVLARKWETCPVGGVRMFVCDP